MSVLAEITEIPHLPASPLILLPSMKDQPRLVLYIKNRNNDGVYYMIIDLGIEANLFKSCARLAVGFEIPQCSLSSVYVSTVHKDSLAQILGSAVLNASCGFCSICADAFVKNV